MARRNQDMTAALQSIANKALKSVYLSNTQGASSALKKAALALQAGSASSLQMSYALSLAASLVDGAFPTCNI